MATFHSRLLMFMGSISFSYWKSENLHDSTITFSRKILALPYFKNIFLKQSLVNN